MIATNYTTLRGSMKEYFDRVTEDSETLLVTRRGDSNVVVMSQETYNNMLENMHLLGNKANYDWLMASKAEFDRGEAKERQLIEE